MHIVTVGAQALLPVLAIAIFYCCSPILLTWLCISTHTTFMWHLPVRVL